MRAQETRFFVVEIPKLEGELSECQPDPGLARVCRKANAMVARGTAWGAGGGVREEAGSWQTQELGCLPRARGSHGRIWNREAA